MPECDMGFIMDIYSSIVQLFAANGFNDGKVPQTHPRGLKRSTI